MATDTIGLPSPLSRGPARLPRAENRRCRQDPASFLGWFSIGVGADELLAPAAIARLSGASKRNNLVRFDGAREVAAGAGILAGRRRAGWLWARVAGDILNIASISALPAQPPGQDYQRTYGSRGRHRPRHNSRATFFER